MGSIRIPNPNPNPNPNPIPNPNPYPECYLPHMLNMTRQQAFVQKSQSRKDIPSPGFSSMKNRCDNIL